jgi:hypothetical protein
MSICEYTHVDAKNVSQVFISLAGLLSSVLHEDVNPILCTSDSLFLKRCGLSAQLLYSKSPSW